MGGAVGFKIFWGARPSRNQKDSLDLINVPPKRFELSLNFSKSVPPRKIHEMDQVTLEAFEPRKIPSSLSATVPPRFNRWSIQTNMTIRIGSAGRKLVKPPVGPLAQMGLIGIFYARVSEKCTFIYLIFGRPGLPLDPVALPAGIVKILVSCSQLRELLLRFEMINLERLFSAEVGFRPFAVSTSKLKVLTKKRNVLPMIRISRGRFFTIKSCHAI